MKMFVVNPDRPLWPVREIEMTLHIGNKGKGWAWAVDCYGRRRLIGSTVFHTRVAAERVQIAAVAKLAKDTYLQRWYPDTIKRAKKFLQEKNITIH